MNSPPLMPANPELLSDLFEELSSVIVGQHRLLERLVACMLAEGHALLEGVPGVGKTMALATLATSVGGQFSRIQFTPDLLPSDIVGTRVYKASTETFDIERGPVFANFVLADEINRAPAKVQSALLEVMAERQVSIGGHTLRVPSPFLVLATQNPIESEGVFPLPDAQRDRFMMRILVDLPTPEEERQIVDRMHLTVPKARCRLTLDNLKSLQALAAHITMPELVTDYAVRLTLATRDPAAHGVEAVMDSIRHGVSPRATISLVKAARAMALIRGRSFATSQDVYDVAFDVINHRLGLTYEAIAEGATPTEATAEILRVVAAPAGL